MKKFRDMSIQERREYLERITGIEFGDLETDLERLNSVIENVVGRITLPVGVVFGNINGRDRIIFLSLEEPSVVAAANKAFKLSDGFVGSYSGSVMIGNIYIRGNAREILDRLNHIRDDLERESRDRLRKLEKYGGGFQGIDIHTISNTRGEFVRLDFRINVGDAMGANIINSFLEDISEYIKSKVDGKVLLRILSNLSIHRRVTVTAKWSERLREEVESRGMNYTEVLDDFLDVISIAHSDIYRKTTYNKGIMNGISSAALAYGQDWRAIEASIHTYSNYFQIPLTTFWREGNILYGKIDVPMAVGTVGGSVKSLSHPKVLMDISGVKDSGDLGIIMASVGLANNFGANFHLSTEGIQRGHMKLHARNIAISVGAQGEEIDRIVEEMIRANRFSYEFARELLGKIR
ncbi:MAG: 3-hydroxy-3-methylglutaryl-CoA reductase [Candidatus Micrarchaeota archaeon]|nr:3-hydroxy-3-methylglutaryl-CoA reductase [Candidatus Micrarchaeota archaeon]MCX8154259.1 3-hydroxy-3-methylglutaryl-CoA reductase [Candidatus Micrarchaeota archaeon]